MQTRAAASFETHPLPEYLRRGLNVVLNTDNRLMSGVTLTDEYMLASRDLGTRLRRAGAHGAQRIRERVPAVGRAPGAAGASAHAEIDALHGAAA